MKRIAILGSTGSIGFSTLSVIGRYNNEFKAAALSANSNIGVLSEQIKKYKPDAVCVADIDAAKKLQPLKNSRVKIFSGPEGILKILEDKSISQVVMAISGSAALLPLIKAIDCGKDVVLANKEALVMAGPIIMARAAKKKVKIIPVDSEQSAIWQCLEGQEKSDLKKIYLTASGGPFRNLSSSQLNKISVKDALKHPRWKMGRKITIDSATLMNKGLELLEAMYLFGVESEKIEVVIHPEAIVHSMVEYKDGVVLAQLSITDMCIPIQYALTYPKRLASGVGHLDFFKLKQLNFEKPDFKKFGCLRLAYEVAKAQGSAPCVLNAANEVCVEEFLKGGLGFAGISRIIEAVLSRHKNIKQPGLNDIFGADQWAREEAKALIERNN